MKITSVLGAAVAAVIVAAGVAVAGNFSSSAHTDFDAAGFMDGEHTVECVAPAAAQHDGDDASSHDLGSGAEEGVRR